jgi:hypothetical protein
MMTEVEARTKGAAMMQRLKGTGWKLKVWENFGWHCAAENKFITVFEHDSRFSALLTTKPECPGVGETYWSEHVNFADPNEAVLEQMKTARAFLNKCRRATDYVEKAVGIRR